MDPNSAIPDCYHTNYGWVWQNAYCESTPPIGSRLTATNDALSRIAARGGECANIATTGRQLLSQNKLRYFPNRPEYAGGYGRSDIGALLADYWVDSYATVAASDGRTLDSTLVHEIDHVFARDHAVNNGITDPYHTPNSKLCAGL